MKSPDEMTAALRDLLMSPEGVAPTPSFVTAFASNLRVAGIEWRCWSAPAGPRGRTFIAALALPGRTAVLMLPPLLPSPAIDRRADALEATVRAALTELAPLHLHYVQALAIPTSVQQAGLLESCGFHRLTGLEYLERSTAFPWVEPPHPTQAQWVSYTSDAHAMFATTIAATYSESRDCPELTEVRPIEDALASHKAAGAFDPRLWELALIDGMPAGCVLLSHCEPGPLLEVVYMGVVAEFRRRGVGRLLMRRALQRARERGVRGITLVVDERNDAARRLYAGFGFALVARRDAWLRMPPETAPLAGNARRAGPVEC